MINIQDIKFGYNSYQAWTASRSSSTRAASTACWARTAQARVHYYI